MFLSLKFNHEKVEESIEEKRPSFSPDLKSDPLVLLALMLKHKYWLSVAETDQWP